MPAPRSPVLKRPRSSYVYVTLAGWPACDSGAKQHKTTNNEPKPDRNRCHAQRNISLVLFRGVREPTTASWCGYTRESSRGLRARSATWRALKAAATNAEPDESSSDGSVARLNPPHVRPFGRSRFVDSFHERVGTLLTRRCRVKWP